VSGHGVCRSIVVGQANGIRPSRGLRLEHAACRSSALRQRGQSPCLEVRRSGADSPTHEPALPLPTASEPLLLRRNRVSRDAIRRWLASPSG
jgi:hypothetical protein